MAERQFGPYRLVRQIAVGGMAEIHLAKTKGIAGFEKYVALKMIHPNFAEDEQFIQMLVDEAKIAVQLTHGNIAQTFDLGRVGETYYITMEYVDGSDLYKVLRNASEQEVEMPLDICAFVGKEIASALDHAHRKRDHTGKSLGIVHRDVSPQNVLVSYAGEVKLVDFGIAKATMKARQTAAGVIKGKYYYMSPEQAWGDPIDFRSDIFSAGIVLYEMMTGQMLYLEEDLHKLLDMARKADIAPPSTLRKGIPPQLERIVMHALAKVPGERYQSASDFASDLERFLHAYSPVFSTSKLSGILRQVVGEPMQVADEEPEVEVRGGPMSTHPLDQSQVAHKAEEIRDENSVIFRPDALEKPTSPTQKTPVPPVKKPRQDVSQLPKLEPAAAPRGVAKLPSRPPAPAPRKADENTRELGAAPGGDDLSGLLAVAAPPRAKAAPPMSQWDQSETHPGPVDVDDEEENRGEATMITGPGFIVPERDEDTDAGQDEVEYAGADATVVNAVVPGPKQHEEDDEPATISRDFREQRKVQTPRRTQTPPAALAAKIQAPAVSELRKPRTSRKTPSAGTPAPSAIQAIVGPPSAPMPAPRVKPPTQPPPIPARNYDVPSLVAPMPQAPVASVASPPFPPPIAPGSAALPQIPVMPTPAVHPFQNGVPMTPPTGVPNYYQYAPPQQQVSPQQLYGMNPYGQPMPNTLTGQLRLSEVDEMPSHYNLGAKKATWVMPVLGILALVGIAAGVAFAVSNGGGSEGPSVTKVHVDSTPSGADVKFDGALVGKTPFVVDNIEVGTPHALEIRLDKYKPYTEKIEVPKNGVELTISKQLAPITGKLSINTTPAGADIIVGGRTLGRTPGTLSDLDISSVKRIELRLKDYQPIVKDLAWPDSGEIQLDERFKKQ